MKTFTINNSIVISLILAGRNFIFGFQAGPLARKFGHGRQLAGKPSISLHERLNDDSSWVVSQRSIYNEYLAGIDKLQTELASSNSTEADDIQTWKSGIDSLEKKVNTALSQPIPPASLSRDEYVNAISAFLSLPPFMRLAFVLALEYDDADTKSRDPYAVPEIVSRLFQERARLTPQRLTNAMKEAKSSFNLKNQDNTDTKTTSIDSQSQEAAEKSLNNFFDASSNPTTYGEENIKNFIPRVARKDDAVVTPKDLEVLTQALSDKSIFIPSQAGVRIPGGYVIPGSNRKQTGDELIKSLDAKLPKDWDCTVSYMLDLTNLEAETVDVGSALVLLKNDFSLSTSPWFYRLATALATISTLLFSVGVYANEAVINRLSEAQIGDFASVDWFNGKVADIILPFAVILAAHEIGHLIVAKQEKIETELPSFMPIWSSLPLLGSVTRLKSSPRNRTALFDFAFMGPLLGFVSSLIFLGVGLLATKSVLEGNGDAAQYLPALPVSVLKLSTLGSSIIDNFFGADGLMMLQSPDTPISLHPYAIAGYCGLLINAVEMLPLGANDGGRLSLSMFGRQGHTIIGGFTWFALLLASFNLTKSQGALLIAAWVINNVVQNDQEIPCRDETEDINLPRSVAAFALWFLAILTFVPL